MRSLLASAAHSIVVGAASVAGVALAYQLQDSTSMLRLRLAELADRLREVTP